MQSKQAVNNKKIDKTDQIVIGQSSLTSKRIDKRNSAKVQQQYYASNQDGEATDAKNG